MKAWFAFSLLMALLHPVAVQAGVCGPPEAIIRALKNRYGETAAWAGVDVAGRLVVIYDSPRTWTLVITLPDKNVACIVRSGDGPQTMIRGVET